MARYSTANSIDPVLTGLFAELTQDRSFFRALDVAPAMPIEGMSGQFVTASDRASLNLDETDTPYGDAYLNALPLDAEALPAAREFTTGSITMDRYAIKSFIPDRVERHWSASGGFSARDVAVRDLAEKTLGVLDYKVFNFLSTSGNFGTTQDPGDFNTVSTDLVDPMFDGVRTIENAVGRRPNLVVMNPQVAHTLMENDDLTRRSIANGGTDGTYPTEGQLATYFREMFGLELVIARSTYEASAGTRSYSMGNHIAILYTSAMPGDPGFFHLFHEDVGFNDTTIATMSEWRSEDPAGIYVKADVAYVVSSAAGSSSAGYLLTDVLS
jgi:hypothetical protein